MARIRVKKEFRARFSEKLLDLGNIAAGAMIFGQFISGNELSVKLIIVGFVLTIVSYIISYIISE